MTALLEKLKQAPELPHLIHEMNKYWAEEKEKRKAFYELVHEDTKAEFINGEVIIHQSPVKNKHWVAVTNIGSYLTVFVNQNKLGQVGIEKVMIRCTRNDYEPDIVFFSKEKVKEFTPNQMIFPPSDLVVEVLSESTKKNDYGIKFQDYAAHQIKEYWIVNTDEKSIEQYILKDNSYQLHQKLAQKGTLKSAVVTDFEIEIESIFL